MTYRELAALCDCNPEAAKLRATHLSLVRKKSRDGLTRCKLDLSLTVAFFAKIRDSSFDLELTIADLRRTHAEMAQLLQSKTAA